MGFLAGPRHQPCSTSQGSDPFEVLHSTGGSHEWPKHFGGPKSLVNNSEKMELVRRIWIILMILIKLKIEKHVGCGNLRNINSRAIDSIVNKSPS